MELLIVTGLSGAGKSNAVNCLEDLGYYCIDNMPPALISSFISLEEQNKIDLEKAAFVMDIRGRAFFRDLEKVLSDMRAEGKPFKVLFLDASEATLVRRFKETRRIHPLSADRSELDAIREEKKLLQGIRDSADYIIDTTDLKTAELQTQLIRVLQSDEKDAKDFRITIMSFGYKHGMPIDGEIVFDVRFLPNPYYIESLKKLTGNNKKVRSYVMNHEESRHFVSSVNELIRYMIPMYIKQGKRNLVLAFGCTGGQHRSVSIANEFYDILREDWNVKLIHRDILKK